jgi:tyrosine-protein kinase Etk/Wzc
MFGLDPKTPGLGDLLRDPELAVIDAVRVIPQSPNLMVIASGDNVQTPAELLMSPRFAELLEKLAGKFQHVIVDTPPLLAVSDPVTICRQVHGVLLALRIGRTTRRQAERCMDMLEDAQANVIGIVGNAFAADHAALRYGYGDYVNDSGAYAAYSAYGPYAKRKGKA